MKRLIGLTLWFLPLFAVAQYEPRAAGERVAHTYFSLDYNEQHEQPNWVYYRLTHDLVSGSTKRRDDFRPDPAVSTGSAALADYKGSPYDRGHLCPAADMKLDKTSMSETFFLSNMSPQDPSLNRGRWAQLEALVRGFVRDDRDTIYVVTGPLFFANKGAIGANEVTVPGYFYKAVYCPSRGGIGFLMPNRKVAEPVASWVVSIDLLEALTGIDFFPQLADDVEDRIEQAADPAVWGVGAARRAE